LADDGWCSLGYESQRDVSFFLGSKGQGAKAEQGK
jgi:hypothetical protein